MQECEQCVLSSASSSKIDVFCMRTFYFAVEHCYKLPQNKLLIVKEKGMYSFFFIYIII